MKVKRTPQEFQVEEVVEISPGQKGEYALYRLSKWGANTLDVLRDVARRMGLPFSSIGYGGLKDRHALSHQYITVRGGRAQDLRGKNYRLHYLGPSEVPMGREKVLGNRFSILVRDLDLGPEEVQQEVELVRLYGLPNYFDEQRFGSARHGQGFVAKELILGHYERALRLLLAVPSRWDEAAVKRFRRCVAESWGDWAKGIDLAPTPWERRLLEFLRGKRPSKGTLKKAFSLLDREQMTLLLMAYQSFLWNETVKGILKRLGVETFVVPHLVGEHFFWRRLEEGALRELEGLEVPLPSPRLRGQGLWREVLEEVLEREGIGTLANFRTKVKGGVFKAHRRRVPLRPEGLQVQVASDELHPGRQKVFLRFFLPPGSYATLLIKRLFGAGRRRGDE